jgi:hypothetical protein
MHKSASAAISVLHPWQAGHAAGTIILAVRTKPPQADQVDLQALHSSQVSAAATVVTCFCMQDMVNQHQVLCACLQSPQLPLLLVLV